jgi:hypothetical protein
MEDAGKEREGPRARAKGRGRQQLRERRGEGSRAARPSTHTAGDRTHSRAARLAPHTARRCTQTFYGPAGPVKKPRFLS